MLAVGIVRTFLISSVSVVVVALVLIGIAFWRISKRPKTGVSSSETNDSEYLIYSKKGYVLRICYAICVAADYILIILEIAATGLSAYIALTPGAETYPIAVLLIISFIASTFRNALSLKYLRKSIRRSFSPFWNLRLTHIVYLTKPLRINISFSRRMNAHSK